MQATVVLFRRNAQKREAKKPTRNLTIKRDVNRYFMPRNGSQLFYQRVGVNLETRDYRRVHVFSQMETGKGGTQNWFRIFWTSWSCHPNVDANWSQSQLRMKIQRRSRGCTILNATSTGMRVSTWPPSPLHLGITQPFSKKAPTGYYLEILCAGQRTTQPCPIRSSKEG